MEAQLTFCMFILNSPFLCIISCCCCFLTDCVKNAMPLVRFSALALILSKAPAVSPMVQMSISERGGDLRLES